MAPPIPCSTRKKISGPKEEETPQRKDEPVYVMIPHAKTFFLPWISASLPKGRRKIAAGKRKEVATQASRTASIANSFPMAGRAMLIEEAMKGVRKEVSVATCRTALFVASPIMSIHIASMRSVVRMYDS
jgi:hypothetical protein